MDLCKLKKKPKDPNCSSQEGWMIQNMRDQWWSLRLKFKAQGSIGESFMELII